MKDSIFLKFLVEKTDELITQLNEGLLDISPLLNNISDNTLKKRCDELKIHIAECKQYKEVFSFGFDNLETINFHDIIEMYIASSNIDTPKKKRVKFNYIVEDHINPENEKIQKENLRDFFSLEDSLPCMKIIPTQLINNAQKYSLDESTINIKVIIDQYYKSFSFSNIGPLVEDDELKDILDENRGKYAIETGEKGQGIGLYIVNTIVKWHQWIKGEVSIQSGDVITKIGNIPYSEFEISLYFDNQINDRNSVSLSNNFDKSKEVSKFFLHELNRINPLLCKIAFNIFEFSISNNKSIQKLREKLIPIAVNIKYAIMEMYEFISLISCLKSVGSSSIRLIERTPYCDSHKRFDRMFKEELFYLNEAYFNLNLDIKGHLGYFEIYPIMKLFVYGFSYLLLESVKYNNLEITFETDSIDIRTDHLFCFDSEKDLVDFKKISSIEDIYKYRLPFYEQILEQHNAKIDYISNNHIMIYLKYFNSKKITQ